jgi:hypothetical protein
VRRQAEIGLGLLESIQECQRLGRALRQSLEAVGPVEPGPHFERDPAATMCPNLRPGNTFLWRLVDAMFLLYHRYLPFWLIATGKPTPLTETPISV